MTNEEENWLDSEVFECPKCDEKLFRVNHSPFADDDTFYCDSCANRVEVGFYNEKRMKIANKWQQNTQREVEDLMLIIESNLKPCKCGGKFKHNSPRRCPFCLHIVIEDETRVELYPGFYYLNEDEEPTEENEELVDKFLDNHVCTENYWK